jgi:hypothetical protein
MGDEGAAEAPEGELPKESVLNEMLSKLGEIAKQMQAKLEEAAAEAGEESKEGEAGDSGEAASGGGIVAKMVNMTNSPVVQVMVAIAVVLASFISFMNMRQRQRQREAEERAAAKKALLDAHREQEVAKMREQRLAREVIQAEKKKELDAKVRWEMVALWPSCEHLQ